MQTLGVKKHVCISFPYILIILWALSTHHFKRNKRTCLANFQCQHNFSKLILPTNEPIHNLHVAPVQKRWCKKWQHTLFKDLISNLYARGLKLKCVAGYCWDCHLIGENTHKHFLKCSVVFFISNIV